MDRSTRLLEIEAIYDRGLYLDAYEHSHALGPLTSWRGEERVLAARLAGNLGGSRLARVSQWLAARERPESPLVRYYTARSILERKGPLRALEFTRATDVGDGSEQTRADWLSFQGYLLATFRDFDRADAAHEAAQSFAADRAWIYAERAAVLTMQDRYEEALSTARQALAVRPWYRPAVLESASVLVLLARDDEAMALLREAGAHVQSAAIHAMLATLLEERGQYEAARAELDRVVERSPLMDKHHRKWNSRKRADLAYECGDVAAAVAIYRADGDEILKEVADHIESAPAGARRKLLDVPFVRQHHLTCAPATLTMISRFWSMPAEHLAVAEQICFDGTPAHSERKWAVDGGWHAREFTVTTDAAVALIDRGVPFTFTTSETTSGHLQAVVGYDGFKRTLAIRDPFVPMTLEMITHRAFKRYASSGPRGMALVPVARRHLIDELELPDAPLWDQLHAINVALTAHDRGEAQRRYEQMQATDPDHRLTLVAQRALAGYDQDPARLLATCERLLERYPNDGNLSLVKAGCLGQLSRPLERIAWLESLVASKESDLIFWTELARELVADARAAPRARRLLDHVIRRRPLDPDNLHLLANHLWDAGDHARATELYRLAACLADKDERHAQSYVLAAQHVKQQDLALQLLQARFERHAKRSAMPARALVNALLSMDQAHRAHEVLTRAIAARPDDGDLLLFAASLRSRSASFEEAEQLLARARDRSQRTHWLRTAAEIASYQAKHAESLALWREVVERDPLAVDAHRAIAWRLEELESREAAVAHLMSVAEANPTFVPLQQLYLERVSRTEPLEAERVTRRMLEHNPDDAWARRELATNLTLQKRYDEAMAELEQSRHIEPRTGAFYNIRGDLYAAMDKRDAAAEDFRAALRLSVDNEYAMSRLVGLFEDVRSKRDALSLIIAELKRQVTHGDGLLLLRPLAAEVMDPTELLEVLSAAHRDRPDLWHTWAALTRQLIQMNKAAEAATIAAEACERFPLLPRVWLERATAAQFAGDPATEISALERARTIAPWWGEAARMLADAYTRRGEPARSLQTLQSAIAASPSDAYNHGGLAYVLWQTGESEKALAALEHALELEPGYDWAWQHLSAWGAEIGQPDRAARLAEAQCTRRAGEARAWWNFARVVQDPSRMADRLAAIDRAIELSPRFVAAHDYRAVLLVREERYADAIAATHPEQFGDARPVDLRVREAWIELMRGDRERAMELTRALVDENPNDPAGWYRLADLHAADPKAEYRDVALQMTQRFPTDVVAWTHLGAAYDALGGPDAKADAAKAYWRALEINPEHTAAAFALFDMLLRVNDLAEATRVLELLRRHHQGEDTTSRAAALAARRGAVDAAIPMLEQLAASATSDLSALEQCLIELEPRVKPKQIDRLLAAALEAPTVQPSIGVVWIRHLTRRGRFTRIVRTLDKLRHKPAVIEPALVSAINQLCETGRLDLVKRIIRRFDSPLRASADCWGTVGYAELKMGRFKNLVRWMHDWRTRDGVQPWMTLNLSLAHLMLNQRDHAAEVWSNTVARDGSPADTATHHAWLAWHHATRGDVDAASSHLTRAKPAYLDEFYRSLSNCATAVCGAAREYAANPAAVEGHVSGVMKEAGTLRTSTIGGIAYQQSMQRIAALTGSKTAKKEAKRRPPGRSGFWGWSSSDQANVSSVWIWVVIVILIARVLGALNGK